MILKIKRVFYELSTLLVLSDIYSELLLYNSGKHCSHFPNEETEAQTVQVTFPRSERQTEVESEFESQSSDQKCVDVPLVYHRVKLDVVIKHFLRT